MDKNPQVMNQYFNECLSYIHQSFDSTESVEVKDNIISALFKFIKNDEKKIIPLETAL